MSDSKNEKLEAVIKGLCEEVFLYWGSISPAQRQAIGRPIYLERTCDILGFREIFNSYLEPRTKY